MGTDLPIAFPPSRLTILLRVVFGALLAVGWTFGAAEEGWPWYLVAPVAVPGLLLVLLGVRTLRNRLHGVPELLIDEQGVHRRDRLVPWEQVVDVEAPVSRNPEGSGGWKLVVTYREDPAGGRGEARRSSAPVDAARIRRLSFPSHSLGGSPHREELVGRIARAWRQHTR